MSGRFASILQIRVQHEKDEKKMETILEYAQELARKTQLENASHYISAVDVVQNGFDLKLSSQKLLKDLSNSLKKRYNFDFKISKKLMGVDSENGSDLYRFNVSLKLIPVEKNDIFSMDQMQYKVEKVIDNKILARNLTKDNIEQINFENFSKKKWRFLEHERN